MQNLNLLIKELISIPTETEWLEFKYNNFDPQMIGSDISALANSAAYRGKDKAYMIWGVNNETHEILGTDYNRFSKIINNQEIESWLKNTVSKNADFDFFDTEIDGKKLVVLVIQKAAGQPVTFKKEPFIRIGSYTKSLRDYPSMEAQLWDKLRLVNFESQPTKSDLQKDEIFKLLDFTCYFDLQNISIPSNQDGILHYILEDEIVKKQDNGLYTITNLGAILFAKKISDFPSISRKAVRVVQYEDETKLRILKEFNGTKGYAVGFEGLMGFLGLS